MLADAERIALTVRDVDVPLSALGERQSRALGRWMAHLTDEARPDVVLSSPYTRARRTAELIVESKGAASTTGPLIVDERLREKEFGILDGLTTRGIAASHPAHDHHALEAMESHGPC